MLIGLIQHQMLVQLLYQQLLSAGDQVQLVDYAGTWGTNPLQ
jgi:hypothetical protein